MKKFAAIISFLFILILGCSCFGSNALETSKLTPSIISNQSGTIESVSDFDYISAEVEKGHYFLSQNGGQNITTSKSSTNELIANFSECNPTEKTFCTNDIKKTDKLVYTNKTFILQTCPRAP